VLFYYQDEHLAVRIVGWSAFGQLLELMQSKIVSLLVALCQVHLQPHQRKAGIHRTNGQRQGVRLPTAKAPRRTEAS
jgi:hypothetical protein